MKKILILFMLLSMASWSFAADFSPIPMILTGSAEIEYQFDGTELTIPFEMSGTPGAVYLIINTKGMADQIGPSQNGFLGWHYVNGIDTTVYVSPRYERDVGSSTIVWAGTNNDDELVGAGTYDYYLWAYDNITPRIPASNYVRIGYEWDSQSTYCLEVDTSGLPLDKPILAGALISHSGAPGETHGTHFKWEIGGDPFDENNYQTTVCPLYKSVSAGIYSYGGPVFDPTDYGIFYHCCVSNEQNKQTFLKWEFVTDGDAILDEDWLGWDELELETHGDAIGIWSQRPSCYTDRNYIYGVSPGLHQKQEEWNKLRCVSFDGELIFDKMMHEWYMPDDNGPNEYINGSFHHMYSRDGHWLLGGHMCCITEVINTALIIDNPDADASEYVEWQNANGDYFLDMAYQPDFEPAWICLHDEETKVSRRSGHSIDANGFNVIGVSYLGLTTFVVSTQDGTGVDYMAFGDDTVSDNQSRKEGGILCDAGSAYDGLYFAFALGATDTAPTNFTAFDSFRGVITSEPSAVEEEAVAAFAVDQNTPNPFNPTTTIGFTLSEAGHVTVDIYNVAGQKVDTLVNDIMSTGRHSLVWDASGKSAGVYFYSVKSGDFSKTMKMTLLK